MTLDETGLRNHSPAIEIDRHESRLADRRPEVARVHLRAPRESALGNSPVTSRGTPSVSGFTRARMRHVETKCSRGGRCEGASCRSGAARPHREDNKQKERWLVSLEFLPPRACLASASPLPRDR